MDTHTIRGVNLGGWLILERWITPGVFDDTDAMDEYSLCQQLGAKRAAKRLNDHRGTFITEEIIAQIANLGLNTIRLPVGYWLFGSVEPFVDGADQYVDELFIWAEKYSLDVILDVHAAAGSQNGWDHSGRAGKIGWHINPDNITATLEFLTALCKRYGDQRRLIGIEVLNEPHWDVPLPLLIDYYQHAYQIVRHLCPARIGIIFSDSFRAEDVSRQLSQLNMEHIAVDMHLYQLFTGSDRALDLAGHLRKTEQEWPRIIHDIASRVPVIVGEWTAAMNESRHSYKNKDHQIYAHIQIKTFDLQSVGWVYWTAQTQDRGVWSLLDHPEFLVN